MNVSIFTRRTSQHGFRRAPRAAAATALAVLALAFGPFSASATPITVGGAGGPSLVVDPIYFQGFGVFGLAGPGQGVDYTAAAPVPFLSAGNAPNMDLTITQMLQQPAWQHPQDPANSLNPDLNGGVPSTPSAAVPVVADSLWTVRNDAGRPLEDVLLLFTRTIPQTNYPAVDVALDDEIFSVLAYTSLDGTERHYGALALGDLESGQAVDILIRYIVAGPLPILNGEFTLPPLGVAGLEGGRYVPEPGTLGLVLLGLAAIGRCRRA
ncbi:MAG: hypothetical protein DCC71_21455 [Proteobacteria bacterium]|nr:MAG: hypothetical protein DCC71_21455 [Pseudomonadota bacterium]